MFNGLFTKFFGANGGLTKARLKSGIERDKLSDYLPWVAYDSDSHVYTLQDNSYGFIWECAPLYFAGEASARTLEGLFGVELPQESVLQFILHGDPHIQPIIDLHEKTRARQDPLIERVTRETATYLNAATKGIPNVGIPVKDIRLFFCVKFPIDKGDGLNVLQLWTTFNETLRSSGLGPHPLAAHALIEWLRRLLNKDPSFNPSGYDPHVPIRKQVLLGTHVKRSFTKLELDDKTFRCITPKSYPSAVTPLLINKLFGGIEGVTSDGQQIKTPFLFSIVVIMENQKSKIHAKCNFTLRQQGVGSLAPTLMRKKEEYLWAVEEIERGTKFLKMIPIMWVYDNDDKETIESLTRVRRIWENYNFVMQEDKGIILPLFCASLPMGLYNIGNNVQTLARDFIVPIDTLATTMPTQGDFGGFGVPVCPFIGRKGQLFGLDVYDKGATNHNAFVAAGSGGGKSFLVNYIVYNYYSSGARIRIIDIGGSYRKMTKLFGARYIDFSEESDVCMNMFTNIVDPEHDIPVIAPIIAQMAFSTGSILPSDTEMQLIRQAVRWAYDSEGTEAGVDTVRRYLANFRETGGVESEEVLSVAARLAFNLYDYSSEGVYGKFFNGPATFNISEDEFVVLELEHLKPRADLYRVVTMQVVNAVTQDLYLSDRSQKRLVIFDEAYQFLGLSTHMRGVIEEGYRRARKYMGSFWVITQSVLDVKLFGSVGEVILNNSAFKFYLTSEDFERAQSEGLLDYDEFTMHLLKSVKSPVPLYSEIFMDTPYGVGVGRLITDPFSYYVYSSKPNEVAEIEAMVDQGLSYEAAIDEMVKKYRRK